MAPGMVREMPLSVEKELLQYLKISVVHFASDISGMQPSILVDGLIGLLRAVKVTHHDVPGTHADLSVAVRIWVDNFSPATVERLADRS